MVANASQSPSSGETRTSYEVANALGRLNADRPKLGARCVEAVPIAKTIRYFLHALDLYATHHGLSPEQVAREIEQGKIDVRFDGNKIVVVTP